MKKLKTKLVNSKNWRETLEMNSKKNAFTLIELLAIIVILAIIAVITVPIILNIIDNSRRGAASDSAYGYKDAVNKWYVTKLSEDHDFRISGEYSVTNGVLNGLGVNNVEIPLSGDKPSSGKLHYTNNVLDDGCLVIGDYKITFNSDGSVDNTEKGNCDDYVISDGSSISTTPTWDTYYIIGGAFGDYGAYQRTTLDASYDDAYVRKDTANGIYELCYGETCISQPEEEIEEEQYNNGFYIEPGGHIIYGDDHLVLCLDGRVFANGAPYSSYCDGGVQPTYCTGEEGSCND